MLVLFLFRPNCQADAVKVLHARYANDPDAIFTEDGVKFIGPKGVEEDEETHLHRLAHNCRMRFNRSFQGYESPNQHFDVHFNEYPYCTNKITFSQPIAFAQPVGPSCPPAILKLYNSKKHSSLDLCGWNSDRSLDKQCIVLNSVCTS